MSDPPTTEARDTETAIDVLIEAVKDGTIRPDRAWTMSMLALIRRREKQDAETRDSRHYSRHSWISFTNVAPEFRCRQLSGCCASLNTKSSRNNMPDPTPIKDIRIGMRLRNIAAGAHNQIIVTALTDRGFRYRIADDEEIINPHWSMIVVRDGHEAFAIGGLVFWEIVTG